MIRYRAFGLVIDSEIPIDMLPSVSDAGEPDVTIRRADLSGVNDWGVQPERALISADEFTKFLIQHGSSIEVDAPKETPSGLLAVYLMGSCMGAILHQRKLFLLHGSCVTKGDKSILITGESGAGKSTLAAEFLVQGWKLLTDDVAVVTGIEEKKPIVQSSYPSQKLWQDAIERTNYTGELLPLYQEERREKFNVRVQNFLEGTGPLSAVVRLIPTEEACEVEVLNGFAKVNQLMCNTYRPFMICEEDRQQHFQRCVTLSGLITMLVALRASDRNTTGDIYQKIMEALEQA